MTVVQCKELFKKKEAKWFQDFELPKVPWSFEQDEILGWSVNPDDVVAFNMATLHSASGSAADSRKEFFTSQYWRRNES